MAYTTLNPGDYVVADTFIVRPESQVARISINTLNHTMLQISDPGRSLLFYRDFLGMSQVFTFNTGPFTIYYLAYPSAEDAVPKDLMSNLGARSGLLELIHVHSSQRGIPNSETAGKLEKQWQLGFGHLGFTTPNVFDLLQTADREGWKVLKWPHELGTEALNLPESLQKLELHEKFVKLYMQIGFIQDPDG
ncbi:hypothetical protein F5884DRAFT_853135 [Xylogone sp. PMI_703]|nr:hypothetical protein F5884DRAFT_853135 [Xylogone sp. PMI_703]